MKRTKIILISLLFCLTLSLIATISGVATYALAKSDNKFVISEAENNSREIFGGKNIKSSEYLYGFDDSPDYIYIDFVDNGYAVYFRETMELMEYAPVGSLPYNNTGARKYYAGPSNYFNKNDEKFVSVITGDNLYLSKTEAESYSQQISRNFLYNNVTRQNKLFKVKNPTYVDREIKGYSSESESPEIDTGHLIIADPSGATGTKYIPNAQYFNPTNPTHGFNTHGTCGSVVAQLLLSYNNFYNDRRIIAPEHLNGDWNNSTGNNNIHDPANYGSPTNNPNVCFDPMNVTRQTAGSNNAFYNHVIGFVEPDAFNCIETTTTITIDGDTATVVVTVTHPDGTTNTTTTTRPANSGEIGSTNVEHSHNGSNTHAVRNGLRNILGQRLADDQFIVNSDEKGWAFGWSPIDSAPIKSQIDAGRPLIIGMSRNLGGSDHWVLGYGYQDYTYPEGHQSEGETYSGYVVHFGWTNRTRIWVNESWCNAYISMEMSHNHNHNIVTGNIINGKDMELRCACGHRASDSLFNISNGNITGAKYTLNGSISIPFAINGVTITAIANSAFANQTQILQISLPTSITSIGSNAFENCTSLTTISSLNNVQTIGSNAFKGCNALANINIPTNLTNIGYGTFAGCSNLNITVSSSNQNYSAQGNILYNKNKTKIIASGKVSSNITITDTITEIAPYAFDGNSNLTTLHIQNNPIIGQQAFANCGNMNSVYFYSYTVPSIGSKAFSNNSFTLYVPHVKQSAYYTAFLGYTNSVDSIAVTIEFESDGAIVDTLSTYFGAAINELPSPSKTGYNIPDWYDNSSFSGTKIENGDLWDATEDTTVYAKWTPKKYYISFTGYGSSGLADKEVIYDEIIGELPAIGRTGYKFEGWKNQYGEYFTSETIWKKLDNQLLTSDFKAKTYVITYDGNGGTPSKPNQPVEYDSVITSLATASGFTGHTFKNWNTVSDGSGQTISAPYTYQIDDNITLHAQYTQNTYTVTFDKRGGEGGSDGVDAIFGEAMPTGDEITAPTRTGYTFNGYYQSIGGEGIQYYTSDMKSTNDWNVAGNSIIFAEWIPNEYAVTLNKQNGTGGTSSVTATYNSAMPTAIIVGQQAQLITAPTRTGYDFKGYFSQTNGQGTKYYNSDMTSANNWNIADKATIYAHWEPKTYTVTLDKKHGTGGSSVVTATYLKAMPQAEKPTRTGYGFQGYFSKEDGQGTKYYNSDMTSANNWDITSGATIFAYWKANQYNVTLANLHAPTFNTTMTSTSFGDIKYICITPSTSGTITLWTSHTNGDPYLILYDSNYTVLSSNDNGYGNNDSYISYNVKVGVIYFIGFQSITPTNTIGKVNRSGVGLASSFACQKVVVTYDSAMPTDGISVPIRDGYIFNGYFVEENGYGANYYSGPNMTSVRKWDKTSNCTLYADWEIRPYILTLEIYNGMYNEYVLYNGDTIAVEYAPYRSHYEFKGYFTDRNGKGTQYVGAKKVKSGDFYFWEPDNLGETWNQNADLTLYAYWTPIRMNYFYDILVTGEGYLPSKSIDIVSGTETNLNAPEIKDYTFKEWSVNGYIHANGSKYTFELYRSHITGEYTIYHNSGGSAMYSDGYLTAYYTKNSCVAEGSLITLADGSQKPVELLTGNEMLLVWNLQTGSFDVAPILFIDSDPLSMYNVINLYFSDGTQVKVISEHAFWDFNLNKYVFLREDAGQYIGNWFNKQITDYEGNLSWTRVQLVNVVVQEELTSAWSPVTYSHLCYYVNGMLSMPGATTGLINIFEVDGETMTINQEQYLNDIVTYGLFTYEEFIEIYYLPIEIFEAFNVQYFKISIGKGLMTYESLGALIESYYEFFE